MTERVIVIASILKSNSLSNGSRVGVFRDPTSDFFYSLLAILRVRAIFFTFGTSTRSAQISFYGQI